MGARLYGGLDPYTADKIKLIYDGLAGEFPHLGDRVYLFDDTISLTAIYARNRTMVHGHRDPVPWFKGYDSIVREFVGDKAIEIPYQFGEGYLSL